MHRTTARRLAVAATVLLAACGGSDGTTAPPAAPKFPDVAGTYQIDGTIDQLSATQASIGGTITIIQNDRNQPGLTITLNMNSRVQGQAFTFTGVRTSTLSEAGALSFNVGEPGSSTTWDFRGTASGKVITGTHLLIGSTSSFTGRWTGTRP